MNKLLFLFIFCFMNSYAKSSANNYTEKHNSDPIKKIAREIAKSNIYEVSGIVGYGGSRSQQSIRYEQLLKAANIDELTELAIKHKNAVVRLYAFNALIQKLKEVPVALVDQFRKDTTIIVILKDDITHKVPLNVVASGLLY